MQGINHITLVGNIGEQPKLHYVHGDVPMARFSLAINHNKVNNKNQPPPVQWHDIIAWRDLAKYAVTRCSKGNRIIINGALKYNEWVDKNGCKKKEAYILAVELELLT